MISKSMKKKEPTFGENKLATTVGATDLKQKVDVSQPRILIPVEEEVEYEFNQEKFEAYLSASSHSSSPCQTKKNPAPKRTRRFKDASFPRENHPSLAKAAITEPLASKIVGSQNFTSSMPEDPANGVVTLSKRARQRRRQAQARRFAKALESTDGVYKARFNSGEAQKFQNSKINNLPKPPTEEWIRVKRNCSTLEERIRRRRALLARARALVQEARILKEEVIEKTPRMHQVWRPKPGTTVEAKMSVQSSPTKTHPTPVITPKPWVFERLGPMVNKQAKVPIKERLGQQEKSRVTTNSGGRTHDNNIHATTRTNLRIEVQEEAHSQGCTSRRVTFDNPTRTTHFRKEISSSDGEGTVHEKSCQHTIGYFDELYYHAGGTNKSRKRRSSEKDTHCPCSKLIKAVLTECNCNKTIPTRLSVFDRLGLKVMGPKSKRSRGREAVTANMAGRGSSTHPNPVVSQRATRLRSGIIQRPNYSERRKVLFTDDEESDDDSAVASDNTVSSEGVPREALMISTEQMSKMLEEALTKQKESFKFEMEMAMQQMREMHDQQIQALKEKIAEPNHQDNSAQADADSDVNEENNVHNLNSNTVPHPSEGSAEDNKFKELESKINSLISAQEVEKTGIPCPYPRGWESIPYPAKFSLINFTPFDGKGSPTQHLIYFKSHLGVISGNEPLMVRSFVGTLRGAAFDWYRRLKSGSVNSWNDMETQFLTNFFDDDTEVSVEALLEEKQKAGETVENFVKRFRNKAMNCREPISEKFILKTCQNNLTIEVLEVMGTKPSKTWKDLKVRGEEAERFVRRKKAERGQPVTNNPRQNFNPQGRGKAQANAVDARPTFQPQQQQQQQQPQRQAQQQPRQWAQQQTQPQWQRSPLKQNAQPRFPKTYAFKDDEVPSIFKYLMDNNKIQLPPIQNQEEAKMITDPKYCAYHRAVHHPTKSCYHLKDKIQALIDVGVITPKPSKDKKVGANVVSVKFGSVPLDWFQPQPVMKVSMKMVNDDPYGQRNKGLVPYTTPNGEILWVHPDLLGDEQWASSSSKKKSKGKGKQCHATSAVIEGNDEQVATTQLSDEEQEVFTTRSGHEYHFKYPEVPDPGAKTLTELGVIITPSTRIEREDAVKLKNKQSQQQEAQQPKQPRFNRPIRGDKPENSSTQYRFNIMAQLANTPARMTLYELLRLSKETREALQEALANSEIFLTEIKQIPEELNSSVHQCNLATK